MLSGLLDLDASRDSSSSQVDSSVHSMPSGMSSSYSILGSEFSRGVWEVLKHDTKNLFSSSAFSLLVFAVESPDVNTGVLDEELFRAL